MTDVWFTADTHFDHARIIELCKRPFANVEEMNKTMVERWNALVKPGDIVHHLGDFAFGKQHLSWLGRLNGNKFFVEGNHDEYFVGELRRFGLIGQMSAYRQISVNGQKIVLFHYGMRTWHHDLRGTWQLYGHSHGGLPPLGKSCDVGVDNWNFAPVHFDVLREFMETRKIHTAPAFENYTPSEPPPVNPVRREEFNPAPFGSRIP